MKKRSVITLLLLSMLCPGFFSGSGTLVAHASDSEAACEAPPPNYFNVTNVSPTSITLAWGPVFTQPVTHYFQLEGFDNTNSTALPTVYTTAWGYTYAGLTPGHNYTFTLRASYCESGPYGDPIITNSNSGVIIVDLVIGIQQCAPNLSRNIIKDIPFNIGVQSSGTLPRQQLNNPYSAQFSCNGSNLRFSLAFIPSTATVYLEKESEYNGQFSFLPQNNGAAIQCNLTSSGSTIPVFTVLYQSSRGSTATVASLQLLFHQTVSNYLYCGDYQPASLAESDFLLPEEALENATEDRADIHPEPGIYLAPNPFSTNALFRYSLDEASTVAINLYDVTGRLVGLLESDIRKEPGQYETYIDGTALPAGVYFLRLRTGLHHENYTLIKRE